MGIEDQPGFEVSGFHSIEAAVAGLEIFAASPAVVWDPGVPIAASRAGHTGLLDLTGLRDLARAADSVQRLVRLGGERVAIVLDPDASEVIRAVLPLLSRPCTIVFSTVPENGHEAVSACRVRADRLGVVLREADEAAAAAAGGFDFVVAKGNEAGGRVSSETTFVLLQKLSCSDLPVVAWGGVGWHTAAACLVAGATGVVVDWQLALVRESALPLAMRHRIARMDGSETVAFREPSGGWVRLYQQPGFTAVDRLTSCAAEDPDMGKDRAASFDEAYLTALSSAPVNERAWPVGQDAAFASEWARHGGTTGRVLGAFRSHVEQAYANSLISRTMAAGSPLARSHGTTYPIVQGPMTRVSDVPAFCDAVERGGALPMLALALMREGAVRDLLEKTRDLMGNRPWGVGILGFVERDLRKEQLRVIEDIRPPFAIIAGGRPDQAASMEAQGIESYLHVPSAGMLDTFVREGARRFIFEGFECGGHVGPRSSFVLWELMVRTLLSIDLPPEEAERMHVIFAGGIHDARSGAMVTAIAQPLVERGMKFGVIIGTGYLFTEEAVETGAIVERFQRVALESDHTVLVETGPGHAIRCAHTEFYEEFEAEKARLRRDGVPGEEIRNRLERRNMGRLRVASKGIARAEEANDPATSPGQPVLESISEDRQRLEGMYMIGEIASMHRTRYSIRALHEDVCDGAVRRLAMLAERPRLAAPPRAERPPAPLDIAIVGMACMLPGAQDPETYWSNILQKLCLIRDVPADRFDVEQWYDENPLARDRICTRRGGFIDDVPFDPLLYGIPPNSLASIEPGQLLSLELVRRALADAGYDALSGDMRAKEKTSVIIGVGGGLAELGSKYNLRAVLPQIIRDADESVWGQLPEWTEDSFAGILLNVTAGRVSNRFDLGGVNFTVDAACASSLAALYLACRELQDRTSDVAIAGGCETVQNPFGYLCFSTSRALSPGGEPRVFDEDADGIAISEGLAAVVLKRRADAERDGDRIYAIIRGVAGASDGRSKSMTAPRKEGQIRTLRRAYAQAGFGPHTVELFEAHGTGTALGDRTECRSVTALLEEDGASPRRHAIGSVKSMIGHTKCTAGVAGLMKSALALYHRVLPPTGNVVRPNREGGLIDGPLYVNTEARPWIRRGHPRRAGVSAFGFGGTNFHAVLEEYEADARPAHHVVAGSRRPAELFVFRASSQEQLAARIAGFYRQLRSAVHAGADLRLADLAYTVHTQNQPGAAGDCAALVSRDVDELCLQLEQLETNMNSGGSTPLPPGVFYSQTPMPENSPLVFLFPGQGSQYPDMLRALAVEFTEVADTIANADKELLDHLGVELSRLLFPPPAFSDDERRRQADALTATGVAQPALGACSAGMLRLLAAFGIRPDLAAGHSYGEIVALHAARALDEAALYRVSWARGHAMASLAEGDHDADLGTMLAVNTDLETVGQILESIDDVWIANHNSPTQIVISGSSAGIAEAERQCRAEKISTVRIPVACAFHTRFMIGAREAFSEALEPIAFSSPDCPVYGNRDALPYPQDAASIRARLLDQIVSPVLFTEEVEALYADGGRIFIEVGPGDVLTKLVGRTIGNRPHVSVCTDSKSACSFETLLRSLATLAVHRVSMDLDRLYSGRDLAQLDLRACAADAAKKLDPHLWLVNGAYARRASDSRRDTTAKAVMHPPAAVPTQPLTSPSGAPPRPGVSAEVLARFQETMRQFLQTQQSVLESYYRGAEHVAGPPSPVSRSMPAVPDAGPATPSGAAPAPPKAADPAPPEQQPEAPAPSTAVDHEERLLQIVADRTGYPPEMLDLDANMEADLGIDSIKRIEIISAFRQDLLPEMVEPPSWFMERMAEARTMRTVLAGAVELLGAVPKETAPAATQEIDLEAALIEIVADRTGYPADMLDLDANMEADLGIDSIKRVEIISAFRLAVLPENSEPPAAFMENMSTAKSIRDILAGIGEVLGGPAAPSLPVGAAEPPSPERPARKTREDAAPRCIVRAVERPYENEGKSRCNGTILVVDDKGGVAQSVAQGLHEKGIKAAILTASQFEDRDSAEAAVDAVRRQGDLAGVVYLAPLSRAPAFPGIAPAAWLQRRRSELSGALHLLQAVAPELNRSGGDPFLFFVSTVGGGDFDRKTGAEAIHPWRGGFAGLLKSAAREWEQARFCTADFDEVPNGDMSDIVLHEWNERGPVEIGYRNKKRLVLLPVRAEFPDHEPDTRAVEIQDGDVIVATGGARGITAETVLEIAHHVRGRFVLLARSACPAEKESPQTAHATDVKALRASVLASLRESGPQPVKPIDVESRVQRLLAEREIRRTIHGIRDAGSSVEYIPCDVRDADRLEEVLRDVQTRLGRIDVLIHGAGTIEDKFIVDKEADSFDRVIGTKIDPMLTMASVVDFHRLKLLMVYSSVAGFFGNPGQADYAAANEILNRMTSRMDSLYSCKCVSMNWGPWSGAGMVTSDVAAQFEGRGVPLLSVSAGRRAVWQEFLYTSQEDVRVIIGEGAWVESFVPESASAVERFPMLRGQEVRRMVDTGSIRARVGLDATTQRYLSDHRIDDKPVLPLAAAMELMAEAAAAAAPANWRLRHITNLRLFSGIVVEHDRQDLWIRVDSTSRQDAEGMWHVQLFDREDAPRPKYVADVTLSSRAIPAPDAPELGAIDSPFPLSVEDAYQDWTFHGPAFQLIDRLNGLGKAGIDAGVRPLHAPDDGRNDNEHWLVGPMHIDVGPQLATMWTRHFFNTTVLPNALKTYHHFEPLGREPAEVYLRASPASTGAAYDVNVWFVRDGKVLGWLEHLEGAGSTELNRITGIAAERRMIAAG